MWGMGPKRYGTQPTLSVPQSVHLHSYSGMRDNFVRRKSKRRFLGAITKRDLKPPENMDQRPSRSVGVRRCVLIRGEPSLDWFMLIQDPYVRGLSLFFQGPSQIGGLSN